MFKRTETRGIRVGDVRIGGGAPVTVQSMTTTDTRDVAATVGQIRRLEEAGCEIVRVGVPDREAALGLGAIRRQISIPLVADIHFDHRLALEAVRQGVDKLRINPGNIGSRDKVALVVDAARSAGIPIRIGVNAGSLKAVHGGCETPRTRAEKLVAAALDHIRILEDLSFFDIAVSLKASDIATTVEAYRMMAAAKEYPLHLGVTEAGSLFRGTVKSAAGMGILLYDGLGDTVRVSLTADPVREVQAAYLLLQSLGLRSNGVELVSCPTCGRCETDLISIVDELEQRLASMRDVTGVFRDRPLKVAVMGCVVNGPGEAGDADLGIAGGRGVGMLFEDGKVTGRIKQERWVEALVELIRERSKTQRERK